MKDILLKLYNEKGELLKEFDGWHEELNHIKTGHYLYNPMMVATLPWSVSIGKMNDYSNSVWCAAAINNLPASIQLINLLMPKD